MKREYAEAYVKCHEGKTVNLNYLFATMKIYVVFLIISMLYSYMSRRMIITIVMATAILFYGIVAVILKRKVSKLTYYHRFLLTGSASLFGSFIFLLFSMMIVETVEFWSGYYVLLPVAWLFVISSYIGIAWLNAKNGKFLGRTGKSESGAYISGAIFAVIGIVVARITAQFLNQQTIVTITIWGFFLIGAAFALGGPNLLKAYLVKKYEIPGLAVVAYHRDQEKGKNTIWHRLRPLLLILLFLVVLPIVVIAIGARFFGW